MRIRGWSKLAAAATTAFHVQHALLPTSTTAAAAAGHQTLPTQDSSSASSSSAGGARIASLPRLAVVVPTWRGDVDRVLEAVARWPTVCSAVTLSKVDLVLYKAEGEDGSSGWLLPALEKTGGRCFAKTKIVYANLREEDNFYPKGPSVQFYKLFLDEDVSAHFSEYGAISIIEWDVTVAHNTSFERLYHAAFRGTEPFWVKGSVLAGASFHQIASDSNMWHVLGHINGNAIYNNNDIGWFEYVEYTRTRWGYQYAYDVALWATVSDFPYSWPLWQRYASKFVTTNLISNIALETVDKNAISTAIAGDTLFIHGRSIERGSTHLTAWRNLKSEKPSQPNIRCKPSCGDPSSAAGAKLPAHVSTVCDASCGIGGRFRSIICGAGDSQTFGSFCRLCYLDQKEALRVEAGFRWSEEAFAGEDAAELRRSEAFSAEGAGAELRRLEAISTADDDDVELKRSEVFSAGDGDAESRISEAVSAEDAARQLKRLEAVSAEYADAVMRRSELVSARGSYAELRRPEAFYARDADVELRSSDVFSAEGAYAELRRLEALSAGYGDAELRRSDAFSAGDGDPRHVIMCDTMRPPSALKCSPECAEKKDTVCDSTCGSGRYGDYNCNWRGQGSTCRYCFEHTKPALLADEVAKRRGGRVIMCDTHEPPRQELVPDSNAGFSVIDESRKLTLGKEDLNDNVKRVSTHSGCDSGCRSSEGVTRVCDSECSGDDLLLDTRGCGDDTFGKNCRTCYTSMATAKEADSFGDEVIMCGTLEYASADGSFQPTGHLRQHNRRWLSDVTSTDIDCHPVCESTATDTTRNVCDPECSASPHYNSRYGTQGCGDSGLGFHCRTCYHDLSAAGRTVSSSSSGIAVCGDLAVMSARPRRKPEGVGVQLGAYARGESASMEEELQVSIGAAQPEPTTDEQVIQAFAAGARRVLPGGRRSSSFDAGEFNKFAAMPFEKDVARGNLCAFVSSSAEVIGETDATVRSVLTFMPGMRTAIAVSDQDLSLFKRKFGYLPGVNVSRSSNPEFSGLLADKYCGDGAKLIYYMRPGSLLSRTFTSKDTHSPQGELLVGYSDGHGADYASRASARASSILLGFESPVFTFGADLMLPSYVNSELCDLLLADELLDTATSQAWVDDERVVGLLAEVEDISAPEVLAAWAYSRNPEGVWFVNPQFWVSHHLFQTISIWNIPLIKPPFSCSVEPSLGLEDYDLSAQLMRYLDALADGATCESGFTTFDPQTLRRKIPLAK